MEQKEKDVIQEETRKLLEKFSLALDKVKSEEEWNVERENDRRKEGEGASCNQEFRKIIFDNAPNKNEDFILAEKKTW